MCLYTCTAVARLTLALAKLSCFCIAVCKVSCKLRCYERFAESYLEYCGQFLHVPRQNRAGPHSELSTALELKHRINDEIQLSNESDAL